MKRALLSIPLLLIVLGCAHAGRQSATPFTVQGDSVSLAGQLIINGRAQFKNQLAVMVDTQPLIIEQTNGLDIYSPTEAQIDFHCTDAGGDQWRLFSRSFDGAFGLFSPNFGSTPLLIYGSSVTIKTNMTATDPAEAQVDLLATGAGGRTWRIFSRAIDGGIGFYNPLFGIPFNILGSSIYYTGDSVYADGTMVRASSATFAYEMQTSTIRVTGVNGQLAFLEGGTGNRAKLDLGYDAVVAKWIGLDAAFNMAFTNDVGYKFNKTTDKSWGSTLATIDGGGIATASGTFTGTVNAPRIEATTSLTASSASFAGGVAVFSTSGILQLKQGTKIQLNGSQTNYSFLRDNGGDLELNNNNAGSAITLNMGSGAGDRIRGVYNTTNPLFTVWVSSADFSPVEFKASTITVSGPVDGRKIAKLIKGPSGANDLASYTLYGSSVAFKNANTSINPPGVTSIKAVFISPIAGTEAVAQAILTAVLDYGTTHFTLSNASLTDDTTVHWHVITE